MKKFLLLFFCVLSITALTAQNGIVHLNTVSLGMESRFTKNIQTLDGSYAAIHFAGTNPTNSVYKMDANLNVLWRTDFHAYSFEDLVQLEDSSFLLCGSLYESLTMEDIKLVKISKTGAIVWTKSFGGSRQDFGNSIIKLNNGNLLITGTTSSTDGDILNKSTPDFDVLLLEISPSGTIVRQKILGGTGSDAGWSVIKLLNDQGFVIAAASNSNNGIITGNHGDVDMWIFRVDNNYNFIWGKCVGGSAADNVKSLAQIDNNSIIIAGDVLSADGDFPRPDTYSAGAYVKMDLSGNIIWSKMIHSGVSIVYFKKVIASGNGSFVLAGYGTGMNGLPETSYGVDHAAWEGMVYKMNNNGQVTWNRCIGGNGGDYLYDIIKNNAGNYVMCGFRFIGSDFGDYINLPYLNGDSNGSILELNDLNSINGYVYTDSNNNSIKDPGEALFTEGFVIASKPGLALRADLADGKFLFGVDSGNYSTSAYFRSFPPFYDSAQFRMLPKKIQSNFTGTNQRDSFNFRVVSIDYLEEVEISCVLPDSIPTGINFPAKIYFKNNLNKPVDSIKIKIPFAPSFSLVSSSPAPGSFSGDTSIWVRYNFPALGVDSISVLLRSNLPATYAPAIINGIILPLEKDYDTANNRLQKSILITGQNSYINNESINISSNINAGIGRVMPYQVIYHFESLLDTTTAVIKVVKDNHAIFLSSTPAAGSVVADTIFWNIKRTGTETTDTINLLVKISDGPEVHIGDTITNLATLQFITLDTFALKVTDSIRQVIDVICTDPDSTNTSLAAPQGIQWLRSFGGSDEEIATDVTVYDDSSFVVTGITASNDGDISPFPFPGIHSFVTRYNSNGQISWKKTFGGNQTDYLFSTLKSGSSDLISFGDSESNTGDFSSSHGDADVWLMKLDSAGNRLWQKLIGGSGTDRGKKIKQTKDGGYIFLGTTNSHNGDVTGNPFSGPSLEPIWVVKLNAAGNILWQKFFADTVLYDASDIIQSLDGGYIIAGYTPGQAVSIGDEYGTIVKLDNNGNTIFKKKVFISEYYNCFNSIVQNNDSSLVATGYIRRGAITDTACIGAHGDQDILVTKFDKNGNLLFNKYFGGSNDEAASKIIRANDGGYILAGSTNSVNGNVTGLHTASSNIFPETDGWIIKLDTTARLSWQKVIGGNGIESIHGIGQMLDNSIIFSGIASSENNGDIFNYKGGYNDAIIGKIGYANFIRGYVFSDQNGDGIKQSNEAYFSNGFVTSTKGDLVSGSTISEGLFANSADTGTYITKVTAVNPYYSANPASAVSNFNAWLQTDTVNFAMSPIPGIKDLKISLLPLNIARPGFAANYQLKYENVGTTTINNGNVRFIKSNKSNFDSASVLPAVVLNDSISWNFSNLLPQQHHLIDIYLRLLAPPVNNINDTILTTATVYPVSGDTTILNNTATLTQVLTGSFDPNIKTETHAGYLTNEQIRDGEPLNYIVFFQNTGNDTAFRVIVRDTLSNALDWTSFEMISASHAYSLSITDSNKIEWKFDPIILPDSNHNEPASHGFVAFKIKPAAGISAGNIITNKASIYFDYNTAIETDNNITFVSTESYICPGSNTYFISGVSGNHTIQWQVNDGFGYTNLTNNAIFAAITSDTLRLTSPPSSWYGYKFRCLVNGNADSKEFTLKFGSTWKGTVGKAWENAANWNCGAVPDIYTTVFINANSPNYPEINTNTGCRGIRAKNGAYVLVKAGVQLILHGK